MIKHFDASARQQFVIRREGVVAPQLQRQRFGLLEAGSDVPRDRQVGVGFHFLTGRRRLQFEVVWCLRDLKVVWRVHFKLFGWRFAISGFHFQIVSSGFGLYCNDNNNKKHINRNNHITIIIIIIVDSIPKQLGRNLC